MILPNVRSIPLDPKLEISRTGLNRLNNKKDDLHWIAAAGRTDQWDQYNRIR